MIETQLVPIHLQMAMLTQWAGFWMLVLKDQSLIIYSSSKAEKLKFSIGSLPRANSGVHSGPGEKMRIDWSKKLIFRTSNSPEGSVTPLDPPTRDNCVGYPSVHGVLTISSLDFFWVQSRLCRERDSTKMEGLSADTATLRTGLSAPLWTTIWGKVSCLGLQARLWSCWTPSPTAPMADAPLNGLVINTAKAHSQLNSCKAPMTKVQAPIFSPQKETYPFLFHRIYTELISFPIFFTRDPPRIKDHYFEVKSNL